MDVLPMGCDGPTGGIELGPLDRRAAGRLSKPVQGVKSGDPSTEHTDAASWAAIGPVGGASHPLRRALLGCGAAMRPDLTVKAVST